MRRRIILFLTVACLLCCLSGCKPSTATTNNIAVNTTASVPQSTPVPTTRPVEPSQGSTVPPVSVLDPQFSAMPQITADFAEVYIVDDVAIFVFMIAGMDTAETSVLTYDLRTDSVLGQICLGEDMFQIFPLSDGFSVLSLYKTVYRVYDFDCALTSEMELTCAEGGIGMAGLNGDVLLLSQLATGDLVALDLNTNSAVKVTPEPDDYSYVGAYGEYFLLESYSDGLVRVSKDGVAENLYPTGSAEVVGDRYAAAVRGDYVTMFPLQTGDPIMVPSTLTGEMFLDAQGMGLLSSSQNYDTFDMLHYYSTDNMTVAQIAVDGMVVNAALHGDAVLAVFREDYSQSMQYVYLPLDQYDHEPINSLIYDSGILNGREPLPEATGSSETVALIQRLEQDYGVRVVYEPGVFDVEPMGFTLVSADEAAAYEKALLLEQFFAFLPDGLLQEMGQTSPVVIYLCQDIHPTAGGLHTCLEGYNVIFLSITGSNDYFLSVAAHEMAHALEVGMTQEVIAGWQQLMPEDVRRACQNLALTVEYTPDDKGHTPVWFLDAYSRTSEKEDRAVLFAALFDAWKRDDYSVFQYDGLKQKANYWSIMLRQTFECCEDAVFPWDTALAQ